MPKTHAKIIINPTAGANSTYRMWPHIQSLLRHDGLSFDFQYTEGTGHAISLAREATNDGYRLLVAIGGDGTINEVANGLLSASGCLSTVLGIVSTGTGNDFIRSMGIPRDYISACKCLVARRQTLIDAGKVQYYRNGKREERYFINSAGVGFDAEVNDAANHLPKQMGHTIPFVLGLLKTLPAYKNKDVTLNIDGQPESKRVLSIVVSNGAYFGGGMKIAPDARLTDHQMDVISIGNVSKAELLKVFPRVYKGTHISHPKVNVKKACQVMVESASRLLLQADGEMLGEGPATFQIIPAALCVAF